MIDHLHQWIETIARLPEAGDRRGRRRGRRRRLLACPGVRPDRRRRRRALRDVARQARPLARRRRDRAAGRRAAVGAGQADRLACRARVGGDAAGARPGRRCRRAGRRAGRRARTRRTPFRARAGCAGERQGAGRAGAPVGRWSSRLASRARSIPRQPVQGPTVAKACRRSWRSGHRASAERRGCPPPVTSATGDARSRSYNRRAFQHRDGLVVLQALSAAARSDSFARHRTPARRRRVALDARLAARGMVRRRTRLGARQFGLAVGQAGHPDLRRAGHLVRRHRALRRPAAHARRDAHGATTLLVVRKPDFQEILARTSSSTKRCCG